jgi:uroporphyrin-III C-methyltransferase/precorrin-2 dehydrogenase/sirohydrochlorin ferrochelatase
MSLYPIAPNVSGKRLLVVGGGAVASRKIADLLSCGRFVHAVAPRWDAGIDAPPGRLCLTLHTHARSPRRTSTPRAPRHRGHRRSRGPGGRRGARGERGSRNVVDVPNLCSFYVPVFSGAARSSSRSRPRESSPSHPRFATGSARPCPRKSRHRWTFRRCALGVPRAPRRRARASARKPCAGCLRARALTRSGRGMMGARAHVAVWKAAP